MTSDLWQCQRCKGFYEWFEMSDDAGGILCEGCDMDEMYEQQK